MFDLGFWSAKQFHPNMTQGWEKPGFKKQTNLSFKKMFFLFWNKTGFYKKTQKAHSKLFLFYH